MKFIDVELDVAARRVTLPGGRTFSFNWGDFAKEYKEPPPEPSEGVAMKVFYEQFIPNEMFLTFWEMVEISASWGKRPYYARLKDEVRGYTGGQRGTVALRVPVPLWARVWLWLKVKVTRRPAIVYGRRD